ncbi:hypothetical protein [Bifidobacterium aquikefiricola]|uniref:Uncharacterized protein n=1 Tax=Bifidobacterium aquikefiricola TaxID=3059038 RepID=A0AB39U495_9BIFI
MSQYHVHALRLPGVISLTYVIWPHSKQQRIHLLTQRGIVTIPNPE